MAERRLFQDVTDRIVALITDGTYPPGSRLPGERELGERFGVSRVIVREAEIALQAAGWIRIKTGSGVYVLDRRPHAADGPAISAFELTEARLMFESEAAALAASMIGEADIAKLDDLLGRMTDDEPDDARVADADRAFHFLIAAASGNAAVIRVVEQLWRWRTDIPEVRDSYAAICHQDAGSRYAEHADIVAALRNHDPAAARHAMRRHFNRLLESMLAAAEERDLRELQRRSVESRARFLSGVKTADR